MSASASSQRYNNLSILPGGGSAGQQLTGHYTSVGLDDDNATDAAAQDNVLNSTRTLDDEHLLGDVELTGLSLHYWLRQLSLVATLVTFFAGLTGNLLVIYVIGKHANVRVKSVANYYIWNLALADLLFVSALPLTGYATYISGSVTQYIIWSQSRVHLAQRLSFLIVIRVKENKVITTMVTRPLYDPT